MGNRSSKRPLSPHLQIYKFQLTSVLSILHRLTGLALSLGFLFFMGWIGSLAQGKEAYESFLQGVQGWVQILLGGWVWALSYHTCQGVRHLLWDMGWGYELKRVHQTGWIIVILSFCLTGLVVWFSFVKEALP